MVAAMSGGVDSSVSAALLKDQGFEVIGITMQIWPRTQNSGSCCGAEGIADAGKAAYKLGIPHYALNFRDVFNKKVIADFCKEYRQGRTPNPCIRCNQYIKFDTLLNAARQLDADYIATGHYARIKFSRKKKRFILKKGKDLSKDQSYVLYTMTQKQLKNARMPLGELTKTEVRAIARRKNLPMADKPESQEICFIPDNDYGRFLKKRSPESAKPGPILDKDAKVIGRHRGIIYYTIGQRKGIGIADKHPLYVARIDKKNNTIVVGAKADVYSKGLIADNLNFIYMDNLKKPLKVKAKVRYLHPPAEATVLPRNKNKVEIRFDEAQWAITPGQAAVFYKGDIVVGGGTIEGNLAKKT